MARITTTILVLMLLMNGTVTIMSSSGLSEDIGVELAPGISDKMETVVEEMKKGFSPNANVVESFVSLAIAGVSLFQVVVEGTYAAPSAFMNLGFPAWFVIPISAPLYLLATLEVLYIALGRQSV
jgi:hypothetical protein